MCDGCANKTACKALEIPESKEPRKEACFEPVPAVMSFFKMGEMCRGTPVAHYLIKDEQLVRV